MIDVEIVAGKTPVEKPYGDLPEVPPSGTPAHYRRIDHCVFPEATPVGSCYKIMTDAQACMDMCNDLTELQCHGVNIVPAVNPTTVYKNFKDTLFIPFSFTSLCRQNDLTKNAKVEDRVCYPLLGREKTDTVDRYIVTDDPDDPAFYSTCLLRIPFKIAPPGGKLDTPPRPLEFNFRGKVNFFKKKKDTSGFLFLFLFCFFLKKMFLSFFGF